MFLIDSHCHLNKLNYNQLHKNVADVMAKAHVNEVKMILAVCTTLSDFYSMIKLIGNRKDVIFSCGIHPLNLKTLYSFEELKHLANKNNVVALGETGLDYYHKQNNKIQQQKAFCDHINIGKELNKPLIVHMRNSYEDTLTLLHEEQADKCGGVLHSFTGDLTTAKIALDFGFYISFSGIVTFNNITNELREVVRYVPLDLLLVETDSPYLTPVPFRGKENQPAYVRNVAEHIAMLKGVSLEVLATTTSANFIKLFHIDLQSLMINYE